MNQQIHGHTKIVGQLPMHQVHQVQMDGLFGTCLPGCLDESVVNDSADVDDWSAQ